MIFQPGLNTKTCSQKLIHSERVSLCFLNPFFLVENFYHNHSTIIYITVYAILYCFKSCV